MPPENPPPPKSSLYSRFIPREELSSFEAWSPGALSASGGAPPGPRSGVSAANSARGDADPAAQLRAARQAGYQDGYRDGLVALEGFKQSFAQAMTAQIGALLASTTGQLDALQHDMAGSLTDSATRLAQQIVRSELATRPELVADVAHQALDALMLSARHITLRVHPDDQPLVAQGAGDVLAARGARLIADASIERGGCRVDSDIGHVDASIESRWRRCVAALGSERAWDDAGGSDTDAGEASSLVAATAAPGAITPPAAELDSGTPGGAPKLP
jgi:flagellar assembly protein FliH